MAAEENKQQGEQESSDKVGKKFDSNLKKLIAVYKGDELLKPGGKVGGDDLATVIAELTKEKREEQTKAFKEKAKRLIESKIEFDKFVKAKNKELEQAITNKKKEFNKEMEDLFGLVENIQGIEKLYADSLTGAAELKPEETSKD